VTREALERLQPGESRQAWDRFDTAFDFRPSTERFPAITEPAASVTWSLAALADDPRRHRRDALVALIQDALTAATPHGGTLLILEWQHTSYRLRPHLPPSDMFLPDALANNLRPGWPRSPYPNGDYPVVLAEDLRYGSFGHPWEHSLCLFGAELLAIVAEQVTGLLHHVLRRGGQGVAQA
jgi:hypothetical protein